MKMLKKIIQNLFNYNNIVKNIYNMKNIEEKNNMTNYLEILDDLERKYPFNNYDKFGINKD